MINGHSIQMLPFRLLFNDSVNMESADGKG